jgi:hypothetical protein
VVEETGGREMKRICLCLFLCLIFSFVKASETILKTESSGNSLDSKSEDMNFDIEKKNENGRKTEHAIIKGKNGLRKSVLLLGVTTDKMKFKDLNKFTYKRKNMRLNSEDKINKYTKTSYAKKNKYLLIDQIERYYKGDTALGEDYFGYNHILSVYDKDGELINKLGPDKNGCPMQLVQSSRTGYYLIMKVECESTGIILRIYDITGNEIFEFPKDVNFIFMNDEKHLVSKEWDHKNKFYYKVLDLKERKNIGDYSFQMKEDYEYNYYFEDSKYENGSLFICGAPKKDPYKKEWFKAEKK